MRPDLLDPSILAVTLAILALICLSAFFSGSETALTSASRGKLRAKADKGDRRAETALRITNDRERLIGALLLGNNLVNILAAALATSLFTRLYGDSGVALATLIMTLLILVFAEVMPKTYAISNAETVSRHFAPIIGLVVRVFFPVVAVVQFTVDRLLSLGGARRRLISESRDLEEELAGTIALGHSTGAVKKEDRDRLLGALDLGHRTVREIMSHRSEIEMVNGEDTIVDIIDKCTQSHHTRIPVYLADPENIIGVLHARDLLERTSRVLKSSKGKNGGLADIRIEEVVRAPYFIPETTTLDDQLRQFLRGRSHFGLVVDEYGALLGLVTLEDILEEIVGDIVDEHDAESDIKPVLAKDGSLTVGGSLPIRELNRELGWHLPEEPAATIAGLLINEAQMIPEEGQAFIYHGIRFEVVERQSQRITLLRIRKIQDP